MTATVHIAGLTLDVILGVTPRERSAPRRVVVDVELEIDAGRAAETDRLEDTVDYTVVRDRIVDAVSGTAFHLIESLMAAVLTAVSSDTRIRAAVVSVTKPDAMRMASAVSTSVRWRRADERVIRDVSPSSGAA